MSREQLLDLSRKVSAVELEARRVRHGSGIVDALAAVQSAIARRIDRIESAEREEPPLVKPDPDAATVLRRLRAHLCAGGHGAQARLALASGLSQAAISKFAREGSMGDPSLRRLEAALGGAERDGRPE